MAGAAARDPDAIVTGELIEQQVAVGRVFVLADARLEQRRAGEGGEMALQHLAHPRNGRRVDGPIHRLRIRLRAVRIERHLHATMLEIR